MSFTHYLRCYLLIIYGYTEYSGQITGLGYKKKTTIQSLIKALFTLQLAEKPANVNNKMHESLSCNADMHLFVAFANNVYFDRYYLRN